MRTILRTVALALALCAVGARSRAQSPLTILHSFLGGPDGGAPSSLAAEQAGALYGATQNFGTVDDCCGSVFRLTPPATGQTAWTNTVLHAFSGPDGQQPSGRMVIDGAGALYGTTSAGGALGCGTVYKVSPPAAGQTAWTETVLHSFSSGWDGCAPQSGLISDASCALYGTT